MKQYLDTLYDDSNAVIVDYNKKHFSKHSNTRDDEETLNIGRSKTGEAIKREKCMKAPRLDDSTEEEQEALQ